MQDVVLSLIASVIAGTAVWLGQRLLRYRRLARKRSFFGVAASASSVLVAPRHFSSPQAASVHRRDMAALVELATIVNDCGGTAEVVSEDGALHGIGHQTEFCVGGPVANPRTAAHSRSVLPGVRFESDATGDGGPTFGVGATAYPAASQRAEYVVLAKAYPPVTPNPVFVIAGQTARANLAAARHLATRYRSLLKKYGVSGRFCLVLKVVEPLAYGADFVAVVADASEDAFAEGRPSGSRLVPDEPERAPDDQRAD